MTPGKTALIVISVLIIIAIALGLGLGLGLKSDSSTAEVPVEWVLTGKNTSKHKNLLFSTDGSTWTQSDSAGEAFNSQGYDVAYGYQADKTTPLWVAVGNENAIGGTSAGTIMYSVDGKKWSESSGASFPKTGGDGFGVAYGLSAGGAALWVAVGNGHDYGPSVGNILYSSNGLHWYESGPDGASFGIHGNKVAFGMSEGVSIWVAGGNHPKVGEENNNILWSGSTAGGAGSIWNVSSGVSLYFCHTVAFGLSSDGTSLWLAGGSRVTGAPNNMLYSTDGKEWLYSTDPLSGETFDDHARGLAFGTSNGTSLLWVAAGKHTQGLSANLMWSDNGRVWNHSDSNGDTFETEANNVAYRRLSNDTALWIAVGENSAGPSVMTSTNGKIWNYLTSLTAGFLGLEEMFGVASDRLLYNADPSV